LPNFLERLKDAATRGDPGKTNPFSAHLPLHFPW
jgi:hypothetical protein